MRQLLSMALAFFIFTGCSHLTIQRNDSSVALDQAQDFQRHSFVWGFVPARRLPPETELCPKSKIGTFEVLRDSGDVWISIATLGIYVPHRVTIRCAKSM